VGAKPKAVVLQFDEVISESPKGAKDIAELVFISPKSGVPKVDWGRSKIEIRPSKGWKPNTVYSVVIKRGLQDLRNNGIDSTIRLVFSTGGPIPNTRVSGVAFDWAAGNGLAGALVEAIAPDSTTYQVVADSTGRYVLQYLPPGPYLLRAYGDRNTNRSLDPIEVWDSVSVTLTQSADIEFYGFAHDTVGLRVSEVTPQDSAVLKVVFGPVMAQSPGMMLTLKLVASLWLALCALRLWREAGSAFKTDKAPISVGRVFVTTLANPKALIFAFGILPQGPLTELAPWFLGFCGLISVVALGWIGMGVLVARSAGPLASPQRVWRAAAVVLTTFATVIAGSAIAAVY
jgi:hypothetical protein